MPGYDQYGVKYNKSGSGRGISEAERTKRSRLIDTGGVIL